MRKGYRKPRKIRPVEKDIPKGYDSGWEYKLHTNVLTKWSHHSDKISYVVEHKYEPDFTKVINGVEYLLEAKGRFWDYNEYNKYIWIRKCLKDNQELVFLFSRFIKQSQSKFAIRIRTFINGLIEGALSIFKMKKKWAFIFHTLFIWSMYQ